MNRRTRRRQQSVAAKERKAKKSVNKPAPTGADAEKRRSADPVSPPNWRRALMTTAALTGAVGLLPLGAVAQPVFTDTPTPGDDNTELTFLPDNAVADALAGNDTVNVMNTEVGFNGAATVTGGEGDDNINISSQFVGYYSTAAGQVLGDVGADTIMLDDSKLGNRGAGTVSGGDDNDSIALSNNSHLGFSATGTGQVLGDAGDDTIALDDSNVGRAGAGTVSGGEGSDSVTLSDSSHLGWQAGATGRVLGDAGDDVIAVDSSIVGAYGAGTVDGGGDNDSISLSGSALAFSATGTGQVLGGAGDDTITVTDSDVGRAGAGTVSGGEGSDSVTFSDSSHLGLVAGASGQLLGDAGDDTITLSGSDVGYSGSGTVSGGEGNDSIMLSNGSHIGRNADASGQVLGGAGNDAITLNSSNVGRNGAGAVFGGDGDDSIALQNGSHVGYNSSTPNQVLGDAGDDTIILDGSYVGFIGVGTVSGGEDNDSITLTSGSHIGGYSVGMGQVLGDAGDDTIVIDYSYVGGSGSGAVSGGAGNDSIVLSNRSHIGDAAGSTGQVLGDAGDDTIMLENSSIGGGSGFAGAGGAGTVSGGEGNDSIILTGISIYGNVIGNGNGATGHVMGDAGDDTIELAGAYIGQGGGSGTVDGGEGNDSIFLNDSITLASGAVLGNVGNDTINVVGTMIRNGTIGGGEGDDSIILANGEVGIATRVGAQGRVLGGAGDDTVSLDETAEFEAGAVVDGGDGVDELAVTVAEISESPPGEVFQNFEAFRKDGAGTLTVTETFAFAERASVTEGALDLSGDGALTSAVVNVDGGTLRTDGGALASGADVSVAAAARLEVNGDETVAALMNDGAVEIAGGSVFRAGTISNNAGGTIDLGAGATLEGTGNTLNNASTINVAAGGSLMDAGDINNLEDGVINFNGGGSVSSGGADGFTNAGEVNLIAGDVTVDSDVENAGTISFAQGVLQTVTVNGDFTQTPDGVLSVNIVGDGSDQLVIAGDVELAGELNIASVSGLQTGENAIEIINADGAVAGGFDVASGLLVGQDVSIDGGNVDVVLNVTVNPVADLAGLSGNQTRIGENLFSLLADPDGDGGLGAVAFAIGLLEDEAEIAAAFDDLHPESLDIGLKYLTASQGNFVDQMFEQAGHGHEEDGLRLWGGVQASGYNQDNSARHLGFDGEAYDFAAGVSGYQAGRFVLGFAGAYGEFNGEGDGARGDDIDAQVYRLAASARINLGADGRGLLGQLSGVVSYAAGETDYEMSRIAGADLATVTQDGSVDIDSFDAAARFTLDGFGGARWPVSPYAEVGVSAYSQDGTVIGAGSTTALAVDALSNTRGRLGLGVRYDHQWTERTSAHFRAAGIHYFGDTNNTFTSRFALAPDDAPAFRTDGREINRQVEFDASLRHRLHSGFSFEATAFGETGDLDVYGARIALNKAF